MPIVRFGVGDTVYDFTADDIFLAAYSDNMGDLVPRTTRLPYLDGGLDQLGDERAPSEIGTVRQQLTIVADTREEMEAKRDALKEMLDWGVQRLYMQPTDPLLAERFCSARINSIQMPKDEGRHTDLHQPVTVIWQASFPRWQNEVNEAVKWGSGAAWGGGAQWGGSAGFAASGVQTDQVVTNDGNATTQARLQISCGVGETCENPTVQRIVQGQVVDEVSYTGVLSAGDELEINARALSVTLNGTDAYTSAFDFLHPAWFRLAPGDNTVRVVFENAGDEATVKVLFYEGYY